jgi:hypothetical protein
MRRSSRSLPQQFPLVSCQLFHFSSEARSKASIICTTAVPLRKRATHPVGIREREKATANSAMSLLTHAKLIIYSTGLCDVSTSMRLSHFTANVHLTYVCELEERERANVRAIYHILTTIMRIAVECAY